MSEKKALMPWTKQEVQRMQCTLVLLGYQPNCDGEMGQKTFSELKRFQTDREIEPTGLFDRPTVTKLLSSPLSVFLPDIPMAKGIPAFLDDRFADSETDA